MSAAEHVHWHEGLFLQPHHLQSMQRRLIEQIAGAQSLLAPYPYGLIAAQLAPDAVANRQIRFDRLRLVMRSGLEIDVPGNTDLPPLELGKAFDTATAPLIVKIGVPLWYGSRANTLDVGAQDVRAKRLYKIAESPRVDENTGQNPQPVLVRRINARLLLNDDDDTDLEVMPLFKVTNPVLGAVGLPRLEPTYFPPCLVISAWEPLYSVVKDLVDQLQATRGKVAREIGRDGFDPLSLRPAQLKLLFRLITLNRFTGRLPSLVRAPRTTPFMFYLELRELLGELAAMQPDGDAQDAVNYDHDDPALSFKDLAERIRRFLGDEIQQKALKFELLREGKAFIARNISKENMELPEYFLAVDTKEDRSKVAELVQNAVRFKMLPASVVLKVAERGVRLVYDHNPPTSLPSAPSLSYFRLMRDDEVSERRWTQMKGEGAVAVTWLGLELPDVRITLYGMVA